MKPNRILLFALCAVIMSGCTTTKDGSLARNKEVLRRAHAEVWSQGHLAAADELYAPDFVCHFIAGSEWKGLEGLKAAVHRQPADARNTPDLVGRQASRLAAGLGTERTMNHNESKGLEKHEDKPITTRAEPAFEEMRRKPGLWS